MSANPQDVAAQAALPACETDPFSDAVLTDPYPFFTRLREAGPVAWLSQYGIYAVAGYKEVQAVLTDWNTFTNTGGAGLSDIRKPGSWRPPSAILESDPPVHTGIRSALMRILSPAVVRQWRETFSAEADRIAERLVEGREFDGVRDASEAFVLKVFPDAVGVDMPRDAAVAVGDMNFNAIGPANERTRLAVEHAAPWMAWYDRAMQRESMRPGAFGELLFKAEDEGAVPPGVGMNLARSFLRGGTDTTISGIGFLLRHIAERPDVFAALKAGPERVRAAFDEVLRLESPVQVMFRTTRRDCEVFGQRLAGDTKIAAFIGGANRDPRQWAQPDRFDIDRGPGPMQLAFGAGPHVCIGQMIARLEAECIVGALLQRVRAIGLAAPPTFRLVNTLRTLDRLPLRVEPL
jgi:cytochrome P450